jgi:hypothetical protein
MSIADQWRARLRGFYSGMGLPDTITNSSYNQLVMQLPTGPYSMGKLAAWTQKNPPQGGGGDGEGERTADYRILGIEVSLQDYIKASFLDTLNEPPNSPILSLPVYLGKDKLEKLDGWADWQTLKGFLAPHGLMPFCVFKNAPKTLHGEPYYLCDIRVGFHE